MKLQIMYARTRFSVVAIREAVATFDELFATQPNLKMRLQLLSTEQGNMKWELDSEDEFFAVYPRADKADYRRIIAENELVTRAVFNLRHSGADTWVSVEIWQACQGAGQRASIQAVFQTLSRHEADCRLPSQAGDLKSVPVVSIGHGRSQSWRDLRDHLADRHDCLVDAYEVGARGGHAVRDFLQTMSEHSPVAFLVLTKEDETAKGKTHARQSVIHETGLFQGKLGFTRAIVLLEDGVEDFSHIGGIEQLRFKTIQETFDDVDAMLKREFG